MTDDERKPGSPVDYFEDLTGSIAPPASREVDDIGVRIRRLREEKGLTLEELAHLTGFDADFLARLEENRAQPQLGTIMRLSKALDAAFGRLVSGVGDRLYSITRRGERRTVSRSTGGSGRKQLYTYKSLAPEVQGRHMEALIVDLEANPETDLSVHEGEEFIYVLEGDAVLHIGEERFELHPGDSVYYLSTTPHQIAAKQDRATIVAVLYGG